MRAVLIAHSRRTATHLSLALRAMDISLDYTDHVEDCAPLLTSGVYDIMFVDIDELDDSSIETLDGLTIAQSTMRFACVSRDGLWRVRSFLVGGFDEFLLKPLDRAELHLRVGRLASNRSMKKFSTVLETVGDLSVDHASREVRCNGALLSLTPRERSVLILLLQNKNHVVSKDLLADRIFRGSEEVGAAAIETYVHRLRRKLSASTVEITTSRGLGYVLEACDRTKPRAKNREDDNEGPPGSP